MRRIVAVLAGLLILATCQDSSQAPTDIQVPDPPSRDIVDSAHGTGGQMGFYFLPPLVQAPQEIQTLDPNFLPYLMVRICELAGSECALPALLEFTKAAGSGSEVLRLSDDGNQYIVNWDTAEPPLDEDKTYRIEVWLGELQLGFADVDVVSNGAGLRSVDTDQFIGLKDGRTLPIKFWIEEGGLHTLLEKVSGDGQFGLVNREVADPLVVRVTSESGVPIPGIAVDFGVSMGGGQLSHASARTDLTGSASVQWTLGSAGQNAAVVGANNGEQVTFSAKAMRLTSQLSGAALHFGPVDGTFLTLPAEDGELIQFFGIRDAAGFPLRVTGVAKFSPEAPREADVLFFKEDGHLAQAVLRDGSGATFSSTQDGELRADLLLPGDVAVTLGLPGPEAGAGFSFYSQQAPLQAYRGLPGDPLLKAPGTTTSEVPALWNVTEAPLVATFRAQTRDQSTGRLLTDMEVNGRYQVEYANGDVGPAGGLSFIPPGQWYNARAVFALTGSEWWENPENLGLACTATAFAIGIPCTAARLGTWEGVIQAGGLLVSVLCSRAVEASAEHMDWTEEEKAVLAGSCGLLFSTIQLVLPGPKICSLASEGASGVCALASDVLIYNQHQGQLVSWASATKTGHVCKPFKELREFPVTSDLGEFEAGYFLFDCEPKPWELSLTPSEAEIAVGGSVNISATILDIDHQPILGAPVRWTSDAPSVAVLQSSEGPSITVTGVGPGTAYIHAVAGDLTTQQLGTLAEIRVRYPDSDGDGVPDDQDLCPGTPAGTEVDGTGCPVGDADGDGVPDSDEYDGCVNNPDCDGDGVNDGEDQCQYTPSGSGVGKDGCRPDTDGDGVYDEDEEVGCEGLVDCDFDGVFDGRDQCPDTPSDLPDNILGTLDENGCTVQGRCLQGSSGEVTVNGWALGGHKAVCSLASGGGSCTLLADFENPTISFSGGPSELIGNWLGVSVEAFFPMLREGYQGPYAGGMWVHVDDPGGPAESCSGQVSIDIGGMFKVTYYR